MVASTDIAGNVFGRPPTAISLASARAFQAPRAPQAKQPPTRPAGRSRQATRGDLRLRPPAAKQGPPVPADRQIAVITGASRGIGHATACGMLELGYGVVAIASNPAAAAALRLELQVRYPTNLLDVRACDLSKMRDVRRLGSSLCQDFAHIDVLINNAGRIRTESTLTGEGNDEMLAVNALAPWALSCALLPSLRQAPRPRIVQVSSDGHRGFWFEPTKLDLDDLQGRRVPVGLEAIKQAVLTGLIPPYPSLRRYFRTKLVALMLSYELARRLEGTMTVNNIHPGYVRTALGRDFPKVGDWMHNLTSITPAQSAVAIVELADMPHFASTTGAYFDRARRRHSSKLSYDQALAAKVWQACEALLPP